MKIDTSHCTRKSDATKVRKAAETFPARLLEVHGGRIVLRDTAVYCNNKTPIDVQCTVCGCKWKSKPDNLTFGKGCPDCAHLRKIASAGTIRCRRASDAEKELAKRMRATGMSYQKIGDFLGRNNATIIKWLDPEYRERQNQLALEKSARDRASGRKAELDRNYNQTPHGKQNNKAKAHNRRGNEYHCRGYEFMPEHPSAHPGFTKPDEPCGYRGFVEFDIWDEYVHGDPASYRVMEFKGANEFVKELEDDIQYANALFGVKHSVEHLIPLNAGGEHAPYNLAITPMKANSSKRDKRTLEHDTLMCRNLFNIK